MTRVNATNPVGGVNPAGGAAPKNDADRFLEKAMAYLGQPYLWGGGHGATQSGPAPVDCSGLITQAARQAGINLDGTAAAQQDKGRPVAMNDLKPGDLVFMGNPAHHVGIYIGDGKVLHSPHTGDHVKISPLEGYGWDSARRVFDEAGGAVDTSNLPVSTSGGGTGSGGGDSNGVGGGTRSSGLGLGGDNLDEMRRKIMQTYGSAGQDGGQAGGPNPAAPAHSGLQGINSKNVPADLEGLMQKLEGQGVSKEYLQELSEKYGVPLEMILGVIKQESGGDANAKSGAGAMGLMQLMPDTARGLGVNNPMDPKQNVEGGVKYLSQMLRQFDGDKTKALAAYNAGPGNVQKYGGVPPFAETQKYVANITASMDNAQSALV